MDKIKKIVNYVSWIIIGMTGILLLVNWENIPETVVTHIGAGISYGGKKNLILFFIIEVIINAVFTAGYDVSFIREMKKTRQSSYLAEIISMAVRVLAVLIISAFILQEVWR